MPTRRAQALAASLLVHLGLLALASLLRPPARIELVPSAPVAITLTSQPSIWPGLPNGRNEGARGGADPVPRAARPALRTRLKRASLAATPAEVPAETTTPVAAGVPGGAPAPGTGGVGTGGGDPFARNPRFRWVVKVSPGRYRLFVPPGYDLEMQLSFAGVFDSRLEVTTTLGQTIASFTKRGPSRWSYENRNPTGRVLLLDGPDRHDCRYGQIDLRARVGFEDRTDRDCNEPDVFLRLVRR